MGDLCRKDLEDEFPFDWEKQNKQNKTCERCKSATWFICLQKQSNVIVGSGATPTRQRNMLFDQSWYFAWSRVARYSRGFGFMMV